MNEDYEVSQGKTAGDLGQEALWFTLHTIFAVLALVAVVFGIALTKPDPDASLYKLVGTILGFLVPMIAGFIIAKIRRDRVATYVWISGMLVFAVVCVWVLDLPTGVGLCEKCVNQPVEKLYRTFFDVNHGSGLMGGDGWLVGTCIPLSMIGYAIGARFGLTEV